MAIGTGHLHSSSGRTVESQIKQRSAEDVGVRAPAVSRSVDAKLKVLLGKDASQAREWLGQYLSVIADGYRPKFLAKLELPTFQICPPRKLKTNSIGSAPSGWHSNSNGLPSM